MKMLFVYYRAIQDDGTAIENNTVLKGIPLLRSAEDIIGLQDFIAAITQCKTVRILYWQRLEGSPKS